MTDAAAHAPSDDAFLVRLDDALRPLERAEDVTATAARLLGGHLGADRCAYADVEGDEDTFNLTGDYTRDVPSIVGRYRFAQFGAECLRLMRAGASYVVADSETDARTAGEREVYRATRIRAVICVPVRKAGRLVAAMAVHQAAPRAWTPAQASLVERVAGRSWESFERARIARELRQQWRLFDTALSHTPDFTYIFGLDGRFLYVNRALLALWQKPLSEAVGRDFFELGYPPELAERLQRQIQEVIRTRGKVRDQTPFTGPDGSTRHYEYIFVPMFAEDGAVEAVAGSTRDITDRLRGEEDLHRVVEALNHSNLELERFAAIASHDLQEPLRVVAGFMTLLEDRCGAQLGDAGRGYIARALAGTTRMQALIGNLLTYARLGEQRAAAIVDLGEVFRAAVDNLTSRIADTSGTVTADALPPVRGDPSQCLQLLQNLIGNALKFRVAVRPPVVHVSAVRDGGGWLVAVRDNGIGIAPAQRERIFGVFQRAFTTGSYDGSGLGLAICKRIAEGHGGWMRVESQEGVGSVFSVWLPGVDETGDCGP